MAHDRNQGQTVPAPNTGNEDLPPGATSGAADRSVSRDRGAPGSGAGPRHAAQDRGHPDEERGPTDSNEPAVDEAAGENAAANDRGMRRS